MRIRTIWFETRLRSRKWRARSFPSGVALGAVATLILAAVAWLPTAGVTHPNSRLAPADYSMPHKNAAQTEETPATIKRAPVPVQRDPATTIRVDFSLSGGASERTLIKGKKT